MSLRHGAHSPDHDSGSSVPLESHRPGYHFAPGRNWLNDPNGLVWYDGEYHLFYQYNPHGTDWGNMSWGHAVSPDLVAWTELSVAIERTDDELVFSGSVVVDHQDTSGLGDQNAPAMVALYTAAHPVSGLQTQALAHSTDRGRTWTRYEHNPVLDIGSTDFRDPKVFWYEPGGHWVMVVALAAERTVRFYGSPDLLSWDQLGDFGPAGAVDGVWECPDIFELPVDGNPLDTRWVLVVSLSPGAIAGGSGTQYFVGHFDGRTFVPDAPAGPACWLDFGADYYAATSFTETPDGERVLIGWMSNWAYAAQTPRQSFRGSMSIPRIHRLASLEGQIRLVQEPVPASAGPREATYTLEDRDLAEGVSPLPERVSGDQLEIRAVFEPQSAERFGLHVRVGGGERTVVGYDAAEGAVYVDRRDSGEVGFHAGFGAVHSAPLPLQHGQVTLTVLVDRASVEVFGGNGVCTITDQIFPAPESTGLAVFADSGTARLVSLSITARDSSTEEIPSPHHSTAHARAGADLHGLPQHRRHS